MKKYAIIVAGGTGKRMHSETPKQFLLLNGKPIIFHSIEIFKDTFKDIEIIVALPEHNFKEWDNLCSEHKFNIPCKLTEGGEHRFYSVKNCLKLIPLDEESVIGIHDAVRPFITKNTITELFRTAEELGNAIPVTAINESVREINKLSSKPIDRHNLCLVQTPQCFKNSLLQKAYEQEFRLYFTDDATVIESTGEKINLVDGDPTNIKITTPTDYLFAKSLLGNRQDA